MAALARRVWAGTPVGALADRRAWESQFILWHLAPELMKHIRGTNAAFSGSVTGEPCDMSSIDMVGLNVTGLNVGCKGDRPELYWATGVSTRAKWPAVLAQRNNHGV